VGTAQGAVSYDARSSQSPWTMPDDRPNPLADIAEKQRLLDYVACGAPPAETIAAAPRR